MNAHAGCVTVDKESGKFFLFGEYKVQGQVEGGGVSVYSSENLATWEHHGMALGTLTMSHGSPLDANLGSVPIEGHPYISPSHIIQRPKVVYSEGTSKYHVYILLSIFYA